MGIFSKESYARKQGLVDEIITALGDYQSSAYDILLPSKLGPVREYVNFNKTIMEGLRGSSLLYLKSEKNLASYLDGLRKSTKDLVSAASKKL